MKKVVSIVLMLAMLVSATPLSALAASEPVSIWDGTTADHFAGGTGTHEDPYLITSASEFSLFIAQTDGTAHYDLKTDIDFRNQPIDPVRVCFDGHFAGEGHTLSNLAFSTKGLGRNVPVALFLQTGVHAYIHDFQIKGEMNREYGKLAPVVAENLGIISKCKNNANVSASDGAAGICVENKGSVMNCENTGDISCRRTGQGIALSVAGGIAVTNKGMIINSRNEGKILGDTAMLGGITGKNVQSAKIYNCMNVGLIRPILDANSAGQIAWFNDECADIGNCYALSTRYAKEIAAYDRGRVTNCYLMSEYRLKNTDVAGELNKFVYYYREVNPNVAEMIEWTQPAGEYARLMMF